MSIIELIKSETGILILGSSLCTGIAVQVVKAIFDYFIENKKTNNSKKIFKFSKNYEKAFELGVKIIGDFEKIYDLLFANHIAVDSWREGLKIDPSDTSKILTKINDMEKYKSEITVLFTDVIESKVAQFMTSSYCLCYFLDLKDNDGNIDYLRIEKYWFNNKVVNIDKVKKIKDECIKNIKKIIKI